MILVDTSVTIISGKLAEYSFGQGGRASPQTLLPILFRRRVLAGNFAGDKTFRNISCF
jgi:hypothetical protein